MAITINTNFVNDTDGYLLDAKNVKGGYLSVDTLANLQSFSLGTKEAGSFAYVRENSKFYIYNSTSWQEVKFYDDTAIKDIIPAEANINNKLADKNYVSEKMSQVSSGTAIYSYDVMLAVFAQYIYDKVIAENGSSTEIIEALKVSIVMEFQTHIGDEITISLGDALNNAGLDINNIMSLVNYNYIDEIAKNLNSTYLMSISSSWEFNSDINIVEMFENHGITEMEPLSQYFKLKNANIGDNIYFVSPNVPDLWVAAKTNVGIMYGSLDSKVDLSNIQNSISDIENNVNGLLNGDIILNKVKNADNAYRDSENNIISTYYASKHELSQAKSEIANLKETLYGYVLDTTDVEISNIIPYTTTIRNNTYNLVDNVYGLVKEVRGNTIKSENLLVLEDVAETTTNGITYSIKNGVLYLNGTSTANTTLQIGKITNIKLNDIFKVKTFNSNVYFQYGFYNGDTWLSTSGKFQDSATIQVSNENANTITLLVFIASGESISNGVAKPMLVKGNVAPTTYKPYTKQTILPFNTILRGVGSAKDKIVITKNEDNEFYTATNVFNTGYIRLGSMNWSIEIVNSVRRFNAPIPNCILRSGRTEDFLCETYSYSGTTSNDKTCFHSDVRLYVYDSDYTNVTDFKNAINDVWMLYELATPTTEVLTTTLTDSDVMPLLELGGSIEVGESEVKGSSKFEMVYRLSGINPTTTTEVTSNE